MPELLGRTELAEWPVEIAAQRLLASQLITPHGRFRLIELEAYGGSEDPGSHAFRGPTPRNLTMFGPAGHAYVYLSYGCHWMLNIAARPEQEGAAILVRALEPLESLQALRANRPKARNDFDLLSGPGKITQALEISREMDGLDLFDPDGEWRIEVAEEPSAFYRSRRVGLAVGKGDETLWRFISVGSERWASRPRPSSTATAERFSRVGRVRM
ncbi:MAG: DNA-3-methyladenine glycosylase [Armatimonadetes bacterium]|nr:DNA-3-methyladenine glycosylase [Armatimonadota bacterium]